MKRFFIAGLLGALAFLMPVASDALDDSQPSGASISLAGQWRLRLDPQEEGVAARWFSTALPDQIDLPGSLAQRGFGDKSAKSTLDRLTPALKYDGLAWYQRDIDVPAAWQGKRLEVFLERCLWESHAWLDDRPLGTQNSLSTPHVYDLGLVLPGHHVLTVCVDNRYKLPIGTWTHAITDDTQGRWNGLIGRLELRATDPVWVDSLRVYPSRERPVVTVLGWIGNVTGKEGTGPVRVRLSLPGIDPAAAAEMTAPVRWRPTGGAFQLEIPMSAAGVPVQCWDEFNPRLYRVEAGLAGGATRAAATFGFRQLATDHQQITLNGQPVMLRGTVDECIYPLTGIHRWTRPGGGGYWAFANPTVLTTCVSTRGVRRKRRSRRRMN